MSLNVGFAPHRNFVSHSPAKQVGFKGAHHVDYIQDHIITGEGTNERAVKFYDDMNSDERRAFVKGIELGFVISKNIDNNNRKPYDRYYDVLGNTRNFNFFPPYNPIEKKSKNKV